MNPRANIKKRNKLPSEMKGLLFKGAAGDQNFVSEEGIKQIVNFQPIYEELFGKK